MVGLREKRKTDGGSVLGDGDGLGEEVLCDVRVRGDGELDETADPSAKFVEVAGLEAPG